MFLSIKPHILHHDTVNPLLLLLYVLFRYSCPFATPLLGWQQGRNSSCQGLLEDAARGVSSPPPPISLHPHTPLSLFIFERLEYHRIKRLQLCWGKNPTVTPQQFMDNFPLIRDNGVQLNGFVIVHSPFEDMEGSLTVVCSSQQ